MQVRGYPLLPSILLVLPRITVVRGYRHAARRFNRVVFDAINGRRIRRVAAAQMDAVGDAFYVIVMPGTLFTIWFVSPCAMNPPPRIATLIGLPCSARASKALSTMTMNDYFLGCIILNGHTPPELWLDVSQ